MKRLALVVIGIAFMFSPALAQESKPSSLSFFDVVRESLFGDVYATPSQWQPLTAGGLFSEGWNRPWASPPPGEGGAPRQGWLNAFDGGLRPPRPPHRQFRRQLPRQRQSVRGWPHFLRSLQRAVRGPS